MSKRKEKRKQPDVPQSRAGDTLVLVGGGILVVALIGFAAYRIMSPPVHVSSVPDPSMGTAAPSPAEPAAPPEATGDELRAVRRISAGDLASLVDRGDVTVIDVRDLQDYLSGHMPGALQIPLAYIPGEIPYLPKEKLIVTYCT